MTLLSADAARAVRFPLAPAPGESFKGYISRVATHNGHASRYSLLRTIGINKDLVSSLKVDVDSVAHLYRQAPKSIVDMLPHYRADGKLVLAGEVLFAGAPRIRLRWVAPVVLRDREVDLAQWSNRSREFCAESWTWLSSRCPNDECRVKLTWATTSLLFCLKCGYDLRRGAARPVDPALRPILSLTCGSDSGHWQRAADEHLPPEIKGISPETLIELIQVLGATLKFDKVPWRNKRDLSDRSLDGLSYSANLLRGCLALVDPRRVRDAIHDSKDKEGVTKLRAKIRALSLDNKPLQEAVKSLTGIRCISQEEQEQSITVSAAKLKIPRANLRQLILSGGVETYSRSMGGRVRLYDEVMLDGLDDIINDRISISHLAAIFKLDRRVILELEEMKRLDSLAGLARRIYREKQFKRSSSLEFFRKIESLVIRHDADDKRVLLSEVMARLSPGPKPWGSILFGFYRGALEGVLGSLDSDGLNLGRLTVDHIFARRLISGDLVLPRPPWGDDWRDATLRQAEDCLGLYPRDIKILQRIGLLEDANPGTTWVSVRHFAKSHIGTRELAALVSVSPLDLGIEALKRGLRRVAPRVGAWERQRALDAFGVSSNEDTYYPFWEDSFLYLGEWVRW